MDDYSDDSHIGTAVDLRIRDLAEKIREVVNPEATLVWDRTKPDGTPRKVLDVSKLTNLGWSRRHDLDAVIRSTYDWFLAQGAADDELRGIHETVVV
jgi:GDP-L-fucose synthase